MSNIIKNATYGLKAMFGVEKKEPEPEPEKDLLDVNYNGGFLSNIYKIPKKEIPRDIYINFCKYDLMRNILEVPICLIDANFFDQIIENIKYILSYDSKFFEYTKWTRRTSYNRFGAYEYDKLNKENYYEINFYHNLIIDCIIRNKISIELWQLDQIVLNGEMLEKLANYLKIKFVMSANNIDNVTHEQYFSYSDNVNIFQNCSLAEYIFPITLHKECIYTYIAKYGQFHILSKKSKDISNYTIINKPELLDIKIPRFLTFSRNWCIFPMHDKYLRTLTKEYLTRIEKEEAKCDMNDFCGLKIFGEDFNRLMKILKLKPVKLLTYDKRHNDFTFKHGLNIDTKSFNPSGSCSQGGLYFTFESYISQWQEYGDHVMVWISDIKIPDDAVY